MELIHRTTYYADHRPSDYGIMLWVEQLAALAGIYLPREVVLFIASEWS